MSGQLFSVIGLAIVATFLVITLQDFKKEYAVLITLACGVGILAWCVLQATPVIEALNSLTLGANLNGEHTQVLLKALGIALCTQLAADNCKDAGQGAIASKVEFCGRICLLVLALPLFIEVLEIAQNILKG